MSELPLIDKKDKILTVRTAAGKQHVLLHDVDSGRPCLKCKDACPGFLYHFWRKICVNCRCPREYHDVEVADKVPPKALPAFASIFQAQSIEELVTRNFKDDKWAARLRLKQNPEYDSDASKCRALSGPKMVSEFEKLKKHREKEAYGVGKCSSLSGTDEQSADPKKSSSRSSSSHQLNVPAASKDADKRDTSASAISKTPTSSCHGCKQAFVSGENIVTAELTGAAFHFGCFKCKTCSELLIDFIYYARDGEIYCGRCHSELFVPRCAGCDELIFDPTYTEAEGKSWHPNHFCCWACDEDLCEKQYAKDADSRPFCIECYNQTIAPQCGACHQIIAAGSKAMMTGGMSFHSSPGCFKCNTCGKHLVREKCMLVGAKLYCLEDYQKQFTVVCVRCKQKVSSDFMQVQDKRFHKECYNCFDCHKLFGKTDEEAAYPFEGELYCYEHALQRTEAAAGDEES